MVFPSVHLYLDPPTSWNQQQQLATHHQQQQQQSSDPQQQQHHQQQSNDPQQQQQLHPTVQVQQGRVFPDGATRSRMVNIPQPEQALKCPRCNSANTKFCYYNNYSRSQPRHFCKACRRYWTAGGALRNVPVGGGCRRNKRSSNKSSTSSKSSSSAATASTANHAGPSLSAATSSTLPAPPQMVPCMTSLHHTMMDYGSLPNIGLGFLGMQSMDPAAIDHHHASSIGLEQWRLSQIQQFPFLGGMETQLPATPASGIYPFDGQAGGGAPTGSELITQMASVKMEDSNPRGLNFARQYLGVSPRNDPIWAAVGSSNGGGEGSSASGGGGGINGGNGGGWMTNLSGFN